MSATIIAAQRRRTCLLASSFSAPVYLVADSAASAQQSAIFESASAHRGHFARGRKPHPCQTHDNRWGVGFAPRGAECPANQQLKRTRQQTTRRQSGNLTALSVASTTVITCSGYCALAGPNGAGNHCTDPGLQLTSLCTEAVNGVGTGGRSARIWRLCDRQYAVPHQWSQRSTTSTCRGGHLHNSRDSIERIEITLGNSGAVLYGDNVIGARYQYRHQDRSRRAPGSHALRSRRRLLQPAHRCGLDRGQRRTVVSVLLGKCNQV